MRVLPTVKHLQQKYALSLHDAEIIQAQLKKQHNRGYQTLIKKSSFIRLGA